MSKEDKSDDLHVQILGSNLLKSNVNYISNTLHEGVGEIELSWFNRYIEGLSFTDASKKELRIQSLQISNLINESTSEYTNSKIWNNGRFRNGMVVGSIQSGKTASMMGVIGNVLDNGTKIIVLLSGTKVALWHQTLLRVYSDLDNHDSKKIKTKARLILPTETTAKNNSSEINYSSQEKIISDALVKSKKALIFVIPKIKEHIYDLSSVLQRAIESSIGEEKMHMLVIDDESDDASILDSLKSKTIPYAITRLWAGTDTSKKFNQTFHHLFFATYLAYTATPQANILQLDSNPLSPRDFIFALKNPSNEETEITFYEPKGIQSYYTGGEIFYEQDFSNYPPHSDFIQPLSTNINGTIDLEKPLQSYLIGAVINMLYSRNKYSNLSESYDNLNSCLEAQVPNYSMVYHPAAVTDEHFLGKQELVYWLNHGSLSGFQFDLTLNQNQVVEIEAFKNHFFQNEDKWKSWIEIFNSSIRFANETFEETGLDIIHLSWDVVKDALLNEIIPNVKFRVINSKADADSRPRFEIEKNINKWTNVPDNLAIFIAGNVLSRGLTIERLAVTVFARSSADPAADTQMQMQRWFGYRGNHLPYCRVFMSSNQLGLFKDYHYSDKSLKERIIKIENKVDDKLENLPYVLEGGTSRSTRKIDTSKLPLRPSNYSQFGLIEPNEEKREKNLNGVKSFIKEIEFSQWKVNNSIKGYISSESIRYESIIALLESLSFTNHAPSINHPEYFRWKEYADAYDSDFFSSLPKSETSINLLAVSRCPYSIAAYLRFWSHVSIQENTLQNDLFVHPTSAMWRDYARAPPKFYVSIRNGSLSELQLEDLSKNLNIRCVQRSPKNDFEFKNLWGTASGSANQYDDRLFDYHLNNYVPVPKNPMDGYSGIPSSYRPSNHPGHLAIYFIEHEQNIYVGFGLGLPTGSPEHIRSMSG